VAATPDGRLLVSSQFGQIYVLQNGARIEQPALDFGTDTCTYRERGIGGLAIDPEFPSNRYVYVSYIFNRSGECEAEFDTAPVGRVSRFVLTDANTIDRASEVILLDNVPSPVGVHNLDDVEFGKDGYLYVSVGDGGCDYAGDSGCFDSNNAARDMNTLVGKVLRITRDGNIPESNPFTGPGSVRCNPQGGTAPGRVCQEIFATGLRNPWRLAFDPNAAATRFFINDVGQDTWEEINEGLAGADYGWNIREGFCANGSTTDCSAASPAGLTNPIFSYGREEGCASITGGAFVPNGTWPAAYDNSYIFSDYICGSIFQLVRGEDGQYARELFVDGLGEGSATDLLFADDGTGPALYYLTYSNGGEIRRIRHTGASNRAPTASPTATPTFGDAPLTVAFDAAASSDPDHDALTYSWDFGDGSPSGAGVAVEHTYLQAGVYMATLIASDPSGATASGTIRIDVGNTPPQPAIALPAAGQTFAVGQTISLQGSAFDSEDGDLAGSALSWRVLLHHNTHTHNFLAPTSGFGLTFQAPPPENLEAAATSYLEVFLTATDSAGRSTTATRNLMPRLVPITFEADPAGAVLRIDNAQVTTPATFMSWENFGVNVDASLPTWGQGSLAFVSWSDGGAAAHTVVTPSTDSSFVATFTSGGTPSPFPGSPVALPGVVQAEDFDDGSNGEAYLDLSPENEGGQYRQTAVDIEAAADQGGGFNVGWMAPGEWLRYSVTAQAGTYDLGFRVAAAGAGGTFHLEVDGIDKTGPLTIPNTGDWQNWTTVTAREISLPAGPQIWRFVIEGMGPDGVVGNVNYIVVTPSTGSGSGPTPVNGIPAALPGVLQAEDFDNGGAGVAFVDDGPGNNGGAYRDTDVDIEATTDSGGGHNVGWIAPGEWLKYNVSVATPGTHTIAARVAAEGPGGTFHIEIDGIDRTGPIAIPNTGGWQAWTTVTVPAVVLSAGTQVWTVVIDGAGPTGIVGNINFISVSPDTPSGGPTPFTGTPIALPGRVQVENFDNGGSGLAFHDLDSVNSGGDYRATGVDILASGDNDDGFLVGWASAGEWLAFSVDAQAGTFDLEVRVASAGQGGTFHIEANGQDITGAITIPDTGGWLSWTTIRRPGVSLASGRQTLRLLMDSDGSLGAVGNFNWFQVVPQGAAASLLRSPYLQQVTSSSAVVVWTTPESGAGAVRYRASSGSSVTVPAETRFFSSSDTNLGVSFYQHEARLAGLGADVYSYEVLVGGQAAAGGQGSFRTAPSPGTGTVKFIAFGDSGTGSAEQRQLASVMAGDSFDLAIHSGDVAYGVSSGVGSGDYWQYDEWVFGVYEPWLRSRPFYPSIGNHDNEIDNGRPYRDVFVLPENGASGAFPDHAERYYSFDRGPVHFVALDTETAFADPARRQAQLAWLENDLATTAQPWRVVYMHRPPYSSSSAHGSDLVIRQALAPIFERHGVQLVISGHDHVYERSIPWREFVPNGGFVTYLVTGGGGAPTYGSGSGPWTAASVAAHHYVRVTTDGCVLTGQAVGLNGGVFDTFQINRCQ
jgi:glucose/arabinose dehydrogenase